MLIKSIRWFLSTLYNHNFFRPSFGYLAMPNNFFFEINFCFSLFKENDQIISRGTQVNMRVVSFYGKKLLQMPIIIKTPTLRQQNKNSLKILKFK